MGQNMETLTPLIPEGPEFNIDCLGAFLARFAWNFKHDADTEFFNVPTIIMGENK